MELKKKPNVDLEQHKMTFSLIGLAITLSVVLYAFNWTSQADQVGSLGELDNMAMEEEIIPVTRMEEIKPPPPPPPPQVIEILNIVEDDEEIDEEIDLIDLESDENTKVEIVEIVEEAVVEDEIFYIVETMPEFPGGELALRKYIAQNVDYPVAARENDIQGKVYIRFVVTEAGAVDQVQVARGVHPLLDAEAIRVVKGLPSWKPGEQRGKKVKVWYTVPINFQLQN